MRIHTRTPKNTTLHHPSTHSDNNTDQKHHKSLHFRTHLDQSRKCLCLWMRPVESLLVNKGMGRGSSWSSLDSETLESDVSSGRSVGSIDKDRGWPSSSVRQNVAAIKRGGPSPRYVGGSPRRVTPELLDEIREFIEEEHGRISVKIVSKRFTLSRTNSRKAIRLLRLRPLVTRTVPHLQDRHIRDRRKFAEEMLARLALGSGQRISRKISTSRRLDLDVICFSDEKIFGVDAAAPSRNFHTFYLGKVVRRNNATSLFGKHHAPLLSHFSRHIPPKSGLPLHGHSSPRCCVPRSLIRFVANDFFLWVLSAIQGAFALSSCLLSARSNRCVISFHG